MIKVLHSKQQLAHVIAKEKEEEEREKQALAEANEEDSIIQSSPKPVTEEQQADA